MPANRDVLLPERQRLAVRDVNLQMHQIEPGNEFGHRVLDLKAGIHLEKIKILLLIDEKLDGSGIRISGGLPDSNRDLAHPAAHIGIDNWRRRLFDHLLMPPLQRALALSQIYSVSVLVGRDLHFDVAGIDDRFLDIDFAVGERALGLAAGSSSADLSSSGAWTRRIPLPPPPAAAFSMMG